MGEASSTLPLEEEEPQRASYAAAEVVMRRGVGFGFGKISSARDWPGWTTGGGGKLLRMSGCGRV